MRSIGRFIGFIFLACTATSCTPETAETPTRGNLHLLIGESVAPAIVYQVNQFLDYYRQNGANITFSSISSDDALRRFVSDTTRTVFGTRALSSAEREALEKAHGSFLEMIVAYDAVAVVVHSTNPITGISLDEIRGVLTGRIKRWEQLQSRKTKQGSILTYLQDSSDISSYLTTRLLMESEPAIKFLPSGTSSGVLIQEVAKEPSAIGFVGLSWIDSLKADVKILEVSATSAETDTSFRPPAGSLGKYFSPHPAYIHQNSYPLKRAVYMYSKSLGGDLASGFSGFVATFEGQRIFLDHGLVPGTQEITLKKSR